MLHNKFATLCFLQSHIRTLTIYEISGIFCFLNGWLVECVECIHIHHKNISVSFINRTWWWILFTSWPEASENKAALLPNSTWFIMLKRKVTANGSIHQAKRSRSRWVLFVFVLLDYAHQPGLRLLLDALLDQEVNLSFVFCAVFIYLFKADIILTLWSFDTWVQEYMANPWITYKRVRQ